MIVITAALLASPDSAQAQAELVSTDPSPGASLAVAPAEVRLVFSRPLLEIGTSISVHNEAGKRIDLSDGRIDPENPTALVASLPLLFEGKFTVRYVAALLGSSVTLADNYEFTLDLPDPVVDLVSPSNGQAFAAGPIPIRLKTQYVDFNAYNRRIRLYVDGALYTEIQGAKASLDGLTPGVHQIRSILIQLDDQEVAETSTTVYIAVKRPSPANKASAPPIAPAMTLSLAVGLILSSGLMLVGGIWLGRMGEQDIPPELD